VQKALDTLVAQVRRAWTAVEGTAIDQDTLRAVLGHATILSFDVDGADRAAATAALDHVIENSSEAAGAFTALARYCEELMTKRLGADIAGFRYALAIANIALTAPPRFGADVEALGRYSERVQSHLSQYEETKVGDTRVQIDRPCIQAVTDGALDGSLLLVGDPGAGKSAVLSTAATLDIARMNVSRPANISGTAGYHFATQFGSTRQTQAGRGDSAASNCADNSVLRDTGWYRTVRG
jgi:hypothetical protein